MGRLVALKVLNVPDVDWARRYLQAVYVSGQLVHPNIALIFDIGQEENLSYIVREYVEGRSAQERLANREPLPLAEALGIISQVVYAIEHAAEHHIFHGSLSPRKILLGPRDSVKVFGFGLPLTPSPESSASNYDWHALPYTAPERVRGGESPNFAGDVYSVVAVLYHLLSGRLPFSGNSREKIEQRILSAPPKPLTDFVPDIPAGAQKIIDRGLSKDPRARYQLPRELLFDLEENLKHGS
jgi:serine/threonine-protein kinase